MLALALVRLSRRYLIYRWLNCLYFTLN